MMLVIFGICNENEMILILSFGALCLILGMETRKELAISLAESLEAKRCG